MDRGCLASQIDGARWFSVHVGQLIGLPVSLEVFVA
jgi:hypothetical protein